MAGNRATIGLVRRLATDPSASPGAAPAAPASASGSNITGDAPAAESEMIADATSDGTRDLPEGEADGGGAPPAPGGPAATKASGAKAAPKKAAARKGGGAKTAPKKAAAKNGGPVRSGPTAKKSAAGGPGSGEAGLPGSGRTTAEIEAEAQAGEAANAAQEAAALAGVAGKTKSRARGMAKTPPPSAEVEAVAGAAKGPANEKLAGGKAAQVGDMDAAPAAGFDKAAFIAAIESKISAQAPKTLEEADGYEKSGALESVKEGIKDTAGSKAEQASGAVDQATEKPPDPDRGSETPGGPLPDASTPRAPAPVGASSAVPKAKPSAATDLSGPKNETDTEMAQAGVTEEQLANSNEPQFTGALDAKKQGEHHSATAPGPVRAAEAQTLKQAAGGAKAAERGALGAMFGSRKGANAAVNAEKSTKKTENEGARAKVASKIESLYTKTQSATKAILDGIDAKVDAAFNSGERTARSAFENKYKTDLRRFKNKRYSGLRGKGRWLKDKFYKPPAEVGRIIQRARALYIAEMRKVVNTIADIVGKDLTAAKTKVAEGRKEINDYVASLPKDLQKQGAELAKGVQGKLDALNAEVDAKQNELVDKIADRYKSARNEVDARVEAMRAENMGLWERAKAAIVGVIKTIIALKDALMSALKKASNAITTIIKDPIGFLNNLISAFTSGLKLFMGNIKKHLIGGVISWLTGTLGGAGITLPEKFDLKGVVSLVLQVLGVTRENIRTRILRKLGPAGAAIIGKVEQGVAIVTQIISGGPVALWGMILEKVGNLKDMVLGKIQDFIEENIITQGIQWLMSLINPAAAFVKACKMIVDGVMWLWNNAARIIELIDTIAGSALAIAQGSIGAAAAKIEQVLARLTPTLISFLASLLGIGGISDKVKEIINVVRRPINKVIDKVVGKAVKFGRKLMKSKLGTKLKGGLAKGKKWVKDKIDNAKKLGEKAVQKVKKKIYGGDDSPEGKTKRETNALDQGVAHLDKWAGSKVKMAVALPGLMAIKLKNGLKVFDLIPIGKYWGLEARVDRNPVESGAERDQEGETTPETQGTHGHVPGIGEVGSYQSLKATQAAAHKEIKDNRLAEGQQLRDHPDFTEREHVIPVSAISTAGARLGGAGAQRGEALDNRLTTVLLYKLAADKKTRKDAYAKFEGEAAATVAKHPGHGTSPNKKGELAKGLKDLLRTWTDKTWVPAAEGGANDEHGDQKRPDLGFDWGTRIKEAADGQFEIAGKHIDDELLRAEEVAEETRGVDERGAPIDASGPSIFAVRSKVLSHYKAEAPRDDMPATIVSKIPLGSARFEGSDGKKKTRSRGVAELTIGDGVFTLALPSQGSVLDLQKRGNRISQKWGSSTDIIKTVDYIRGGGFDAPGMSAPDPGYGIEYKDRAIRAFQQTEGSNPSERARAALEKLPQSDRQLNETSKPRVATLVSWAKEAGVL